jgi:hypothetical protein
MDAASQRDPRQGHISQVQVKRRGTSWTTNPFRYQHATCRLHPPPPVCRDQREEQDGLQRGQDPHRPQHSQPPGHRGCSPIATAVQAATGQRRSPLVRRRQAGLTSPAVRCGVRKNAAQVSSTRQATACSSSSSRLCSDGRFSGLLPSLTNHQCGRPTAVSRTRSRTPATPSPNPGSGRYAPDRVPVAAARAAHHPHWTAATVTIVMRPKPASTCHGPLAQCPKTPGAGAGGRSRATARRLSPPSSQPDPITVPAVLTTSRCRTQAESAGRLTGDAWPNPEEAPSRQATGTKQNIRLGMSSPAAGAAATGALIGGSGALRLASTSPLHRRPPPGNACGGVDDHVIPAGRAHHSGGRRFRRGRASRAFFGSSYVTRNVRSPG